MHRRRFLGTVGSTVLLGSAGCLAEGDGGKSGGATGEADDTLPTATANSDTAGTVNASALGTGDLPLPDSELVRAAGKDEIPAIVDPAFGADWSAVTATLGERDSVIGVSIDGRARAYPLSILNWHEAVNDSFGGPLLVTYCPLCGSGVTAARRVNGRETTFGVSGYLWQRDLVLYDDLTESLWSQILGRAVRGSRTGERLSLRPSTMTTWGEWRDSYPETEVLLPPPESETVTGRGRRNYNTNPYSDYEDTQPPDFSVGEGYGDDELPPRALVLGVATDEAATAYSFRVVREAGDVINDRVGDLPVVVASTHDSIVAYDRRAGGEAVDFGRDGDALVGGGSRWGVVSGRAREGPHAGIELDRANDRNPMFWFAWQDFFPGTDIYRATA